MCLIVVGFLLPRVYAFEGLTLTSPLSFMDMPDHLFNAHEFARGDAQLELPAKWPPGVYRVAGSSGRRRCGPCRRPTRALP